VTRLAAALAPTLACEPVTPAPTAPPAAYDLWVSNQTTLAVTLAVNGTAVRTVAPHEQASLRADALPPLPWSVEARSPSGRVLLTVAVRAGDVEAGPGTMRGDAARVDLSCGRLDVWSGPPLLGPVPGPGRTGDCEP